MRQNSDYMPMKVIGITGGVGAGKSRVLSLLQEKYGAAVCQLDEVAKRLQRKGGPCYEQILTLFGTEILAPDKELDRKRTAEIMFLNAKKRAGMNAIVHPEVKKWVQADIADKRREKVAVYVMEAALFPTGGYEDICEEFWYIYARRDVRIERLKQTRGYDEEKISQIMASQATQEEFRKLCRVFIDNSGTWEETMKQIGEHL